MKTDDPKSNDVRRVEDPRPGASAQAAQTAPVLRTPAHLIDPYDMRAEPQQEEPGYGHGV